MSVGENSGAAIPEVLSWNEICERHPNEFVVLSDIDRDETTGEIRSALVVGHGATRSRAADSVEVWETGRMLPYFFTGTNPPPLHFPRIVMTDELRELLREPKRVEESPPERVAKFCHDTADPVGPGRTPPDEETR